MVSAKNSRATPKPRPLADGTIEPNPISLIEVLNDLIVRLQNQSINLSIYLSISLTNNLNPSSYAPTHLPVYTKYIHVYTVTYVSLSKHASSQPINPPKL